jgi:hypothetical protein
VLCEIAHSVETKSMNKVVFLHIPKTAGTTLKTVMQRNYASYEISDLYDQQVDTHALKQRLSDEETKLICGHFDYQKAFQKPSVYTFTFLRNPVDRVISNYLHIVYSDSPIHKKWMQGVQHFPDFLNLPQGANWQSRLLAGYKHNKPPAENTLFAEARETLHRLQFVGLKEEFKHSLYCLCIDLDWVKIWFNHENTLPDRTEFDELKASFSSAIEDANQVDVKIYEVGKEIFEERWRRVSNLEKMQCRLRRVR